MSTGRFLGGLFIGGALGVIIGMLLAPRSGEETREMIREELASRANRSIDGVKSRAVELRERARETAEQLREKGEEIASELEEAGRETWNRIHPTATVAKKPSENSPN